MVLQCSFIVKVSNDGLIYKPLKFKVQSVEGCIRLLLLVKSKNRHVKGACYQFVGSNGSVHVWRFNSQWFKATGQLIPLLKDVRKSLSM